MSVESGGVINHVFFENSDAIDVVYCEVHWPVVEKLDLNSRVWTEVEDGWSRRQRHVVGEKSVVERNHNRIYQMYPLDKVDALVL